MSAVAAKSLPAATIAPGCAKGVGQGVAALGGKRALLVTDAGLTGAGITGQIEEYITAAGVECIVYDKVEANPTMSVVEGGIRILQALDGMDDVVIVSVGGGSSMDAAKGMAVAAPDGGAIADYCMFPKLKEGTDHIDMMSMAPKRSAKVAPLPIIAIPTTSGTASETNGASVLTDEATHRKLIFSNEGAVAKMTLLDPELTLKLPAYPTATCGMDALTHSMEALTSNRQNPYSDSIAIGSIQLVAKWLPILMADLSNLEARYNIQLASHMAGVAFGIAGLGICHSVGHPLSALLGKAHGQTLSTMLPHVMAFNMPVRADKYKMVAEAFGVADSSLSDEENGARAIEAVVALSISVGTAKSIEQMGGDESTIAEAVQQALTDPCMLSTPRPATADDITALYMKALNDPALYPVEEFAAATARL